MIKEKAKKLLEKEILSEKGVRKLIAYAKQNPSKLRSDNLIILEFLATAFGFEFLSRSHNGNKIEKKIKQEDEPQTFYWALPLPETRISHQLIHPNRSTLGLTRTRTLHELKDIGLISELTFNETLLKLKDLSIVTEGGVVVFALEREQHYHER